MTFPALMRFSLLATILSWIFVRVSEEPFGRIFWHLLGAHDAPAALLMLAILLAGYGVAIFGTTGKASVNAGIIALHRYRLVCATLLWLVLCAASVVAYHDHPLSMDEYAAVFQAKVFAAGALNGQLPTGLLDHLIPHGFQNHFLMVNRATGDVCSAYWPGFSLLLAPFVALGIPWACNPTIVAISFLLVGRVTREITGSASAAGWALLLSAASPAFVANGITYYSMSAHLLFNLAFVCLLLNPTPMKLFGAGLVGGFALILHNPLPHLAFALPWWLWLVFRRGARVRELGWLAVGYFPVVAVLGVGWSFWMRQMLDAAPVVGIASGSPTSMDQPLLARGLAMATRYLAFFSLPTHDVVNARAAGLAKLWLWATPVLLPLAWWGARKSSITFVRLLGASALVTFLAYFLIRFDQGHGWGYRYFHSSWAILPILGAMGLVDFVRSDSRGRNATVALAFMAVASLVLANGQRLLQIESFVAAHLAQSPPAVDGQMQVFVRRRLGYYGNDLVQNDPWLRGNRITMIVTSSSDTAPLFAHFRERFDAEPEVLRNAYGTTYAGARKPDVP